MKGSRLLVWFLAALLPRLLYLLEQSASSPTFHRPLLDEAEMVESARAILDGERAGEPFFKAPLYPALLAGAMALTGDAHPFAMRLLQHLLGAALCVIGLDAARRLLPDAHRGRAAAGACAAALLALQGPLVRLECQLLLDSLVVFLQGAMLWALLRASAANAASAWKWAAGAGTFAGLAWLTRPTLLPVLPLLAAALLWAGRRVHTRGGLGRLGAAFLLPVLLAVASFAAQNARRSGQLLLQPWQGGYNFYQANRPGANGRYLRQEVFVASGAANPTRVAMVALYLRDYGDAVKPLDHRALDRWWMAKARAAIAADPAAWAGLMLRKAVYLGSAREIYNIEDYGIMRSLSAVLPWLPIGFGVLLPLALASLGAGGLRPDAARLVWIYTLGLGACIALFYTSGRLRAPLIFPAALLAGAAAGTAPFVSGRRKAAAALFAVLGTVWSWGDWWGVRSEDVRAPEYARLSNAYWLEGHPRTALAMVDKAAEADPEYPTLPQLRGQALFSLRRFEEAAEAFREAARRIPGDPVAPFNLGVILYRQLARPDQALPWFEETLRRQPGHAEAERMALRALFRLGRWEEARTRLAGHLRSPGLAAPPDLAYWDALAQGEENRIREAREALLRASGGVTHPAEEIDAEHQEASRRRREATSP